ncbi:MAG: cupin domain-containing protein [Rubrivivax sp.]
MADADTPAPPARAMRRRLMERVADADATHLTVGADQGDWRPWIEGVRIKLLRRHGGVLSYLLRFEPGAALPPHRHPLDEECLVLDGRLRIGSGREMGPGDYHLAHAGSLHASVSTDTGATIFLRGAIPDPRHVLD